MNEIIKRLSDQEIEAIKKSTADVLERVGFRVTHAKLRRLCRKAGAKVNDASETVCFPAAFLRELLSSVPKTYKIADCAGCETEIGGDEQFGVAIVTDPWIVDYETQRPRRPVLADIRRHTVIAQRLEIIKASSRMDFPVSDIEGPHSGLRALEEYFLYQNKHIYAYVTSLNQLGQYFDIASILLDGRSIAGSKIMSVAVAPLTPLGFTDMNTELLFKACRHGFTVIPTSCPIAGATSPYTLAGTLLMGNVENVFLAALTQIVNPGNPFLYAFGPSRSDMHSGHDKYYTLDKVLWKLAALQVGRSYGFPIAAECGGTMTHRYDQQNGAEGVLFMMAAAAGAHLLSGFGSCYNAIGMSAEMMLIQTAWLNAARFLQRGIQFADNRLGAENITAVGQGGTYLIDDLTLTHLRDNEFFTDELFDFTGETGGGRSFLERVHEKIIEMTTEPCSPHTDRMQSRLREYFKREYAKLLPDFKS